MENRATKVRPLDIAFVVDANLLKRLETILREISPSLEYTVKFSDGTTVRYTEVEEVISASQDRKITSLIAGTLGDDVPSGYVTLRDAPMPSVEYTINGPQHNVISFGYALDNWTLAIRQWYSRFLSSGVGIVLLLVCIFLPMWIWNSLSASFPALIAAKGKPRAWIQPAFIVALWVGEYWFFKLFPTATFAIGLGEKRHQFFKYIKSTVLVGVVLSVLTKVVVDWIMHHA